MRYFNTYGPVNEKEHYIVPRRELPDMLIEWSSTPGRRSTKACPKGRWSSHAQKGA